MIKLIRKQRYSYQRGIDWDRLKRLDNYLHISGVEYRIMGLFSILVSEYGSYMTKDGVKSLPRSVRFRLKPYCIKTP